jgi:hypothetical protein
MPKVTLTNEDGSAQDFFPQSYTDQAVSDALANHPNTSVAPDVAEVDLQLTDGSTKKFVAA